MLYYWVAKSGDGYAVKWSHGKDVRSFPSVDDALSYAAGLPDLRSRAPFFMVTL